MRSGVEPRDITLFQAFRNKPGERLALIFGQPMPLTEVAAPIKDLKVNVERSVPTGL